MNRCRVIGGNGVITLSIPLNGGRNQRTLVKDVRILNSERWQDRHWKTITSCYHKSPWFEYLGVDLEMLYKKRFEFLLDWNLACFQWATDKLAITTSYSFSDEFKLNYDPAADVDLRGKLMPSTINELFPDEHPYPQVFADRFGFIPNMSILDFLFCVNATA